MNQDKIMKQVLTLANEKNRRFLASSALFSCRSRGHDMKKIKWQNTFNAGCKTSRQQGLTACKCCGMEVQILTHTAPNQTNISGEAIALNCK